MTLSTNDEIIDGITKKWEIDSNLVGVNLGDASRNLPVIHGYWLKESIQAKRRLSNLRLQQKILMKEKWLYFHGKMSEEEINEKGWKPDPFKGLKVLNNDKKYS